MILNTDALVVAISATASRFLGSWICEASRPNQRNQGPRRCPKVLGGRSFPHVGGERAKHEVNRRSTTSLTPPAVARQCI